MAAPAGAVRNEDHSPYARYVRARAADAAGNQVLAAAQYAAALEQAPGNLPLATRTYRQAAVAGDRALALRSARLLDQASALPPDGRLLILIDNITGKDWRAAQATAAKIEQEQVFAFLVPIVRAWIALGMGSPDAAAPLGKLGGSALSIAYGAKHRALILMAEGKKTEAVDIMRAQGTGSSVADLEPRLMMAQALAAGGDRATALALLGTGDAASLAMRARINGAQPLPAPRIEPLSGLSQLLLEVAIDLNRERVSPLSITLARFALFAAPQNSAAALGLGQLFSMSGRDEAALATLGQIGNDDLFTEAARGVRIRLLIGQGQKQAALDELKVITARPGAMAADWTMLGDIYSALNRSAEAAAAYGSAISLVEAAKEGDERLWTLWLLRGSALEQADAWPQAKAALETALALAPDQAVVLNHLGYSQLERRENIPAARALIEKASKLRPDDAAITDSLGWAHYLQGDVGTAIAKLEAAAQGEPGGSEINEHLGDAYWSAGRRIEARYAWQAAKVTADETAIQRLSRKIDSGLDGSDAAP